MLNIIAISCLAMDYDNLMCQSADHLRACWVSDKFKQLYLSLSISNSLSFYLFWFSRQYRMSIVAHKRQFNLFWNCNSCQTDLNIAHAANIKVVHTQLEKSC